MPAYAVDTSTRPRRATRPRRVADVVPQLPTSKTPDAVAPIYNVVPPAPASTPVAAAASLDQTLLADAPTPVQPTSLDDPATADLKRAAEALRTAKDTPAKKDSRLKAFAKMAAYALGQSRPGKTWTDVAMQVGQGLGGGLSGAIQPKLPGAIQKLYNVQKAEEDLSQAQKYATTASMIDRRADTTRIAEESLAIRAQKAALDTEFKRHSMKYKNSGLSLRERKEKFFEENEIAKRTSKEARDAWDRDFKERGLLQRMREFSSRDEIARGNLVVAQRRAATLEQALGQRKTADEARILADAAEGQALIDVADEYDAAIDGLDKDDDYDEILALKRAKIAAVKAGRAKLAAAGAAGGVRGVSADKTPTMQMKSANLTIEGAISRFKQVNKRNPTAAETARMKAALGQ